MIIWKADGVFWWLAALRLGGKLGDGGYRKFLIAVCDLPFDPFWFWLRRVREICI